MSTRGQHSKSRSSNPVVAHRRILKPMAQPPQQVGVAETGLPCLPGISTSGNGTDSDWILVPRDGAENMAPAHENNVDNLFLSNSGSGKSEPNSCPELPKIPVSSDMDVQERLEQPPSKKRTSKSIKNTMLSQKRTKSDPIKHEYYRDQGKEDSYEEGNCSDTNSKPVDPGHDEGTPDQALSFACPYFRLDPVTNHTCLAYKLLRIRDVKQHLQRRHYLPPFYCTPCCKAFQSLRDYGDHIRVQRCTTAPQSLQAPKPNNDKGVSGEAQSRLKARVSRAVKPAEQWYAVWEILFGEANDRPADPYIGSMTRETFRMFRAFWRNSSLEILPKFLESQTRRNKNTGDLERLVYELFDEVETQFERSLDRPMPGNPWLCLTGAEGPNELVAAFESENLTEVGEDYPTTSASNSDLSSSCPSFLPGYPVYNNPLVDTNSCAHNYHFPDIPPSTELLEQGGNNYWPVRLSNMETGSLVDGVAGSWVSSLTFVPVTSSITEAEFVRPPHDFNFLQHQKIQNFELDAFEEASDQPLAASLSGMGAWHDQGDGWDLDIITVESYREIGSVLECAVPDTKNPWHLSLTAADDITHKQVHASQRQKTSSTGEEARSQP